MYTKFNCGERVWLKSDPETESVSSLQGPFIVARVAKDEGAYGGEVLSYTVREEGTSLASDSEIPEERLVRDDEYALRIAAAELYALNRPVVPEETEAREDSDTETPTEQ